MLNRMTRWAAGILIAGSLTTLVWGQAAAPTPTWKDQGESDIGLAAGGEKNPAKQLELLKKWEQQYPDSALKDQRTFLTAQALLGVMGAAYGQPAGPALDAGEKAGKDLNDKFDMYFADSVKPPALSAPDWAKARTTSKMQIHTVLGYIALTKKDFETADKEYHKVLEVDPTQATASYQLGLVIINEMAKTKDLGRYSEALYNMARSLSVTGPTALPAPNKTQAEAQLKKYYSGYHGSTDGLPELIKQTEASALPPSDFHIMSVVDIQAAKDKDHAAWALAHPDLDFWENIREALKTQGDTYFASLKEVEFPPQQSDVYKGPAKFKGKVVSQPSPKEILVDVDAAAGDAHLKFDDNAKGTIDPGTEIQFKGVVDSYTKEPYVLTLVVQEPKDDIVGLTGVTFVPDAAKKPGAGRAGKAAPKAAPKTAPKK